jgi:hypothetical protein
MASVLEANLDRRLKLDAVFLCMLATWTLVIKYINPLCLAFAEKLKTGLFPAPYIMWDFWWIPHLLLAIWLWQRRQWVWEFAIVVSVVEILIIVTKFVRFFQNPFELRFAQHAVPAPPVLDLFFTLNWFVNKVFVLTFFIFLLLQILRPEMKRFLKKSL